MEEIGDYKIIRKLGAGALGISYQAEHKFLKKNVVVKILPEELTKEVSFLERFEKGILQLSTLDHPHIVKMQTVSSHLGRYFFVTDFIAGEKGVSKNLNQHILEKGPLTANEAVPLLKQLASAIEYARDHQVMHGFLKPSNILIGSDGHIGISDFGLTKILGEEALISLTYRRISENISQKNSLFLENFCFLSPEQKKFQKADHSADVFAFGQICHYMITGRAVDGIIDVENSSMKMLLQETLHYGKEKRKLALKELVEEIVPANAIHRLIEDNVREIPRPLIVEALNVPQLVESVELAPPKQSEAEMFAQASADSSVAMLLKKEPTVTEYHPEKTPQKDMQPLTTKMAIIPSGHYFRGTDKGNRDESPRHQIFLPNFSLDIHPVTNEQFIRFLEYMGGEKDQNYHDLIRLKDSRINRSAGKLSIESGYALHPVVGVTWYGASSYADWIGKRLPTEAEWEVAAAGGVEEILYPTGETIEKRDANFFSSDTIAVKSYQPNGYGLYDMAGNVYEWCQDWYGYNYYETSVIEPNNPKGPIQGVYRVLRGGCWKSLKDDLRISHRHRNNPGTVNGTCGFRCAKDV